MKILIIDDKYNNKQPTEFILIIKFFLKKFNSLLDNNIQYYIRNFDNIDDFLFESALGISNIYNGINFDSIDLIFLTGSLNILPWMKKFQKILILYSMIMKIKKPLFCCGSGFLGLIYLYSSNMEVIKLNLLNNNKYIKCNNLKDLKNININTLNHDYSFLDNYTGNVYTWNNNKTFWENNLNIGLILNNNSNNNKILKIKNQGMQNNENSNKEENICYIKKKNYNHWLFIDIKYDFIIPKKSDWIVNSLINYNNPLFDVLAESINGTQIISFTEYPILSTKFEITKIYKTTLLLLKNFITYQIKFSQFNIKKKQIMYHEKISNEKSGAYNLKNVLANKKIPVNSTIVKKVFKKIVQTKKDIINKNKIINSMSKLEIQKEDLNKYRNNLETLINKNHKKKVNFHKKFIKNKKIKISMSFYNYNIKINNREYKKKVSWEKFKSSLNKTKENIGFKVSGYNENKWFGYKPFLPYFFINNIKKSN